MPKMPKFKDIESYTRPAHYTVHVSWDYLIRNIERWTIDRVKSLLEKEIVNG